MRKTSTSDKIAKSLFILSIDITLVGVGYIYGVFSYRNDWFPVPLLRTIKPELQELLFPSDKILSTEVVYSNPSVDNLQPDRIAPGLLLIVGSVGGSRDTYVRVIDRNGTIIHEWFPRCRLRKGACMSVW